MAKERITIQAYRRAVALGEIEERLRDKSLSALERSRTLRAKRRFDAFFTPPRVAQAYRWQRKVLDVAMRMYPSMCLPTLKDFLSLPDIQAVIVSADAPPQWRNFPARARVPIRKALQHAQFRLTADRPGRRRAK
jgi:hypothetical protein